MGKGHARNEDQYLDKGGTNEVTAANAKDAVTKKHSQNTDTSTSNNSFSVGNGAAGDKSIIANNADTNKPTMKYNDTLNAWQFRNSGTLFSNIGIGDYIQGNELQVIIYTQPEEPTVNPKFLAIWIDTDDHNRAYLIFCIEEGDQRKIEFL